MIEGIEANSIAVVRLTRNGRLENPTPAAVERLTSCFGPRALGVSPRTLAKHLEHIFEKLGVETRTAAAVRAIEAAQAPSWP